MKKHQKYIVLINIVHTETNIFETRMTTFINKFIDGQRDKRDYGANIMWT